MSNMKKLRIKLPVAQNGEFDIEAQKRMASMYTEAQEKRAKLVEAKKQLDVVFQRYVGTSDK